jgi:hypothetical protein
MTRKSYVKFSDHWRGVEVKTLRGDSLGGIAWYERWHQYVFEPEVGTVFSFDCLEDIATKMTEMEVKRKQPGLAL